MKSIAELVTKLLALFKTSRTPAKKIETPLILNAPAVRTGVSARTIAKRIIARQEEAGAPIGNLADGSESVSEKMERIRVEEIIRELTENAKITVVIPPGTPVQIQGTTGTGVPVTGVGSTTQPAIGSAIIQ